MKKLLSLILVTVLILSIGSIAVSALADSPRETLTFYMDADSKATAVIPSYEEMAYWKKVGEIFNVDIKFQHPAAGQNDVEFNLLLASGEMPDIVWYNWGKVNGGAEYLLENGIILDLTELFPEYAPNLYNYYLEHDELMDLAMLNHEKLYSFPKIKGDNTILVTSGFQIRDDWLERLGLEVPRTIDDLHNVLLAFKNEDANGNGDPDDEIPFTGSNAVYNRVNEVLAQCWGIYFNDFSFLDGKVVFGPYTEQYRDYITTAAQWYSEGLIDPDYLSNDNTSFQSKILNDIGGFYQGTINGNLGTFLTAWQNNGSDSHLIPISSPMKEEGAPHYSKEVQSYISEDSAVITSNCKNVELAMKVLDYAYGEEGIMLSNYGIEGESYTMVDGKPVFTDLILNNPDGYSATNALHMYNLAASQGPEIQLSDMFKQIALHPEQVDAYNIFGAADVQKINLTNLSATEEQTSRLSSIMADINTYVDEQANRFIMGLASLDEYDAFVEQLKAMGVEEAIEIKQAIYDKSFGG